MGVFESIIAILAGLVAVGTAAVRIGAWAAKRRQLARTTAVSTSTTVPRQPTRHPLRETIVPAGLPERLVPLIRMAYVLLRLDQLPDVGNWGFTINKYIELNYPHDPEILARKDSYLREGSITHIAHALRGFAFLNVSIPEVEPELVRRWVDRNSTDIGLVTPALPANPDEIRGWAKEIRHTATSTLSLLRLRAHILNESSVHEVGRWVEARARLLLGLAGVWVHDPRMTYSHAYLLELFNLLRLESSYQSLQPQLNRQIIHGMEQLFEMVSVGAPYWCADSHPETKVFYTLLILSRVLAIPESAKEPAWSDRICSSLDDITRLGRTQGGVPLGEGAVGSRFNTPDLGVSAALLECCQRAYALGLPVEHLLRQAAQFVERSIGVLDGTTANAITHTWESVLSLCEPLQITRPFDSQTLRDSIEPLLEDVKYECRNGGHFLKAAIAKLGSICGVDDQLTVCVERDIWLSAVRRLHSQ